MTTSIKLSIKTRNWAAVNPALRKTDDIVVIKLFESKLARVTLCKTKFAEINTKPAAVVTGTVVVALPSVTGTRVGAVIEVVPRVGAGPP